MQGDQAHACAHAGPSDVAAQTQPSEHRSTYTWEQDGEPRSSETFSIAEALQVSVDASCDAYACHAFGGAGSETPAASVRIYWDADSVPFVSTVYSAFTSKFEAFKVCGCCHLAFAVSFVFLFSFRIACVL
jgi:hypothetical protein